MEPEMKALHTENNKMLLKKWDYFGRCGRRRGWDVSREQHQNMYII